MNGDLRLRNRQSTRKVDTRLLRQITKALLTELLSISEFDLTLHLLESKEMALVNQTHLGHSGSTDVITLDYSTKTASPLLAGEIFICIDEAVAQAKEFGTTWQSELARYVIHAVLHLLGHDDLKAQARRRMKSEENRLLKELDRRFHLSKLARRPKLRA
jgi:probable rRNA maturation factor